MQDACVRLLFGAAAIALAWVGAGAIVVACFGWLGLINLVPALFNLVPAPKSSRRASTARSMGCGSPTS